ncbi:MAG: alpha/beta hydrolase [bacterium]|nr:alpha/beta hydrolase [bacterium]
MHRLLALSLLVLALPARGAPRAFSVQVRGSGPPVVLIPGLACGGEVWAPTVARYQAGHQMHVLTLAGFAGQKAIDAPLLSTVRVELATYIKEHHLHRPVIVGHSLGGFLVPNATVETVKPQAEMMRVSIAQSTPATFATQNRAALTTMVTKLEDVEPLAAMGRRSDQKSVAAAMYELMTTDLRPALAKVRAPVLILAAGDEPDAKKVFQAQYATLPGARIEFAARTRHFIFIDDPAFFFAALDGMLGSGSGK